MTQRLILWTILGCFCLTASAQDLSTYGRQTKRPTNPRRTRPVEPKKVEEKKQIESILFNLGTHTEFYDNIQINTSGGTRKFDMKAPTIGAGLSMPIKYGWRFLPEFNWVLPRFIDDSKIIKNLFMFRADFGYDPLDWLRLRIGTSIMWANQHGRGGKAEINNGNSTSTFYYPEENRSSLNNTFDLGLETKFDEWAVRLQTYTYAIFKEERRQVSYTLFISYYWDQ